MDNKEKQLIAYYHDKLVAWAFDERDVYVLLILLRRFAPAGSPVHEFSNFVAHREKDRGKIYDRLLELIALMEKVKVGNLTEAEFQDFRNFQLFTEAEIKDSFNSVFQSLGFDLVPDKSIIFVMFCIMSLLQDVRLVNPGTRNEIGKLIFGYTKQHLGLLVSAPIRHLNGNVVTVDSHAWIANNGIIENDVTEWIIKDTLIKVSNDNGRWIVDM